MNTDEPIPFEMPLTGSAAPPIANGEVVFEEPWQSRVFGVARVLCEQGRFEWDEFRLHLVRQIDAWQHNNPNETYFYFDHFLAALTSLVAEKDICSAAELEEKTAQFEARPFDHDHRHR